MAAPGAHRVRGFQPRRHHLCNGFSRWDGPCLGRIERPVTRGRHPPSGPGSRSAIQPGRQAAHGWWPGWHGPDLGGAPAPGRGAADRSQPGSPGRGVRAAQPGALDRRRRRRSATLDGGWEIAIVRAAARRAPVRSAEPDGTLVAEVGWDPGSVRVYRTVDGPPIGPIPHPRHAHAVVFSPDRQRFLVVSSRPALFEVDAKGLREHSWPSPLPHRFWPQGFAHRMAGGSS